MARPGCFEEVAVSFWTGAVAAAWDVVNALGSDLLPVIGVALALGIVGVVVGYFVNGG